MTNIWYAQTVFLTHISVTEWMYSVMVCVWVGHGFDMDDQFCELKSVDVDKV